MLTPFGQLSHDHFSWVHQVMTAYPSCQLLLSIPFRSLLPTHGNRQVRINMYCQYRNNILVSEIRLRRQCQLFTLAVSFPTYHPTLLSLERSKFWILNIQLWFYVFWGGVSFMGKWTCAQKWVCHLIIFLVRIIKWQKIAVSVCMNNKWD